MNEFFLRIVNMSISASWLVLAVLVLRIVLKKAPRWINVILWGIVAVRLLCPFSIESALSLIPSAETIPVDIGMDTTPAIDSGINVINSVVNPMISQSNTPENGASANPLQITMTICANVWLLGLAALIIYTTISYWCLYQKVNTAVLFKDNIFQSENVGSPFVLGIIKPRIYLPFKMDTQAMEHVIAHERAHIRHRDHWWKPLGFLLLAIHWFNPLMWLAYVLLCRDIELACDERVIRTLGSGQRADYTKALVACSINRHIIAACPLAFGEVGVKERVKSVMNYKKPAFWVVFFAVIACVAVAVCFLTNPRISVRNPWVQEYIPGTGNILGSIDKESFESISEDFAIGADQYGRAVFKDPHKAFETLTELYASGISLIREENNLPPFSHYTYDLYKQFGWQTISGSVEEQAQASFVTKFLDIYENSFSKEIPLSGKEASIAEPASQVIKWFDYTNPYTMEGDGLNIELPEYPGVTFQYNKTQIIASKPFDDSNLTGQIILISGMPIWNAYFTDLTGDGYPEICATYSFGFGMIDNRFVIYDYVNDVSYEMEERGSYDFSLRLNEEDGYLYADKRVYQNGGLVSSGRLVFEDNCIRILAQEAESEPESPDAAICAAILEHYASDKPDGLIHVESHALLAMEVMGGTPKIGVDNYMEETTVYLLVLYQEYSTYGGVLEEVGGSYIPAAITFSISESGGYTLKEYWEPRDGSYYVRDIREKFPEAPAEDALNAQAYIKELEAQCYNQALVYLNSNGGLELRIAGLFELMQSSPKVFSSNPGDYIEAHKEEYQELLNYGEFTLRYCFSEFLSGGQTDLRGYIMAAACEDISSTLGETFRIDVPAPGTGQGWFDAFRANAEGLAVKFGNEELEKYYPASWLLLQMMGQSQSQMLIK